MNCESSYSADASLRRLTPKQYANSIHDIFDGLVQASSKFPQIGTGLSESGFSTDPEMNPITQQGAMGILDAAEDTAEAVVGKLAALLPCYPAQQTEACATQFITRFGRRIYRRPLEPAEQAVLLGIFSALKAQSFELGIASVVATMLQSPQFLYLVESGSGQQAPPNALALSGYEIATRLAYLFWDSTPDDTLLDAAARGALDTPDGILAEAEAMLELDRSRSAMVRFFREWTALKVFKAGEKDAVLFPDYDAALADSIQQQFDQFVSSAVFGPDNSLASLLTTNRVPADERLGKFYGVSPRSARSAGGFETLTLPSERSAGLLTLPALLSGFSHPATTSVVLRGKFVRRKLLCNDLPDPPPDALDRLPDMRPDITPREKSNAIRGIPECGGCHALMDPIGLGFEQFDAIGRFRETDAKGKPIDARGSILGTNSAASGDFEGAAELGEKLSEAEDVRQCLVKQWFRFSYSRREKPADACTLKAMGEVFAKSKYSLRALVSSVVLPPSFRFRSLGGSQ